MNIAPSPNIGTATAITTRRLILIISLNLVVWLAICLIGAVGNYQDNLRNSMARGEALSFIKILLAWINVHLPLFVLSTSLYLLLIRFPHWLASAKSIIGIYAGLSLLFYPLHITYISLPRWYRLQPQHEFSNLLDYLLNLDNFTYFLEFAWFSGTYAITVAVRIWHQGQARAQLIQQTQQAHLELQLAFEQQRMHSLRQQLEPHFIFNALNALSALVRMNERSVALQSINSLSALLRYALSASKHDFVPLGDEVRFLRDYMDLQTLRYGDRLHFEMQGPGETLMDFPCPPLLLQPFVENALRHDLDCHEDEAQISIEFSENTDALIIDIENSLHPDSTPNPGLGLGQSQTRERLSLLYGSQASLSTQHDARCYRVRIQLPLHI